MSAELLDAAEAVIALVPLSSTEPSGGWRRNRDEKVKAAITRLRTAVAEYARLDSRSPSEVYDNAETRDASPEDIR